MYTLEQLQQKTFGELKAIGLQLNVLPAGDRRCRQSWIDAIAGINPPLQQLLEYSPTASVEQVQEQIMETVETSPGVEVDAVQKPIAQAAKKPGAKVAAQRQKAIELLQQKNLTELDEIGWRVNVLPEDPQCCQSWIDALVNVNFFALQYLCGQSEIMQEASPAGEIQRIEAIAQAAENTPGAEVDRRQEPPIESKFGRIVYPQPAQEPIEQVAENSPGVEVEQAQEPFIEAVEASPGAEVDPAESGPECVECFEDGFFEEESGFIKLCQCCSEPKLSRQRTQRAIAPAAKISLNPKSDRNPILTGIVLSDMFLPRYSPPQQSETLHYEIADGYKVDTDGQLSLFEAQVVTEPEPPDPDDFESIDAFREAISRWDWEHNEVSPEHNEPLQVSLDSFSLWGLCPADWYESVALLEPSSMLELSQTCKSSITEDFFIPTFDRKGDRSNRSDEPPDTWFFARLPKPKPPTFPPQASQPQVNRKSTTSQPRIPKLSRNYPETISPRRRWQ
jgi:hypothetical protein